MIDRNEFFSDDVRKAVENFEKMLQNRESIYLDEETLEDIIEFYLAQSKPRKALNASQIALEQSPFNLHFKLKKAQAHNLLEDAESALAVIEEIELLEPTNPEIYITKSDSLELQGRFDEAIACLYNALECTDEKSEIYMHLGFLYESKKDFKQALQMFTRSLEFDQHNEQAFFEIGLCYEALSNNEESTRFYEKFIVFLLCG